MRAQTQYNVKMPTHRRMRNLLRETLIEVQDCDLEFMLSELSDTKPGSASLLNVSCTLAARKT